MNTLQDLEPAPMRLTSTYVDDPGVPHLPPLVRTAAAIAPAAPESLDETGVDPQILADLALKLANTTPRLTSEWAAEQLRLPVGIVERIFWQLRDDQLLEILGQSGPLTYRYAITQRGREAARRLLEISGYVGPAPISLDAYAAMLNWQMAQLTPPNVDDVERALSSLVLPPGAADVAALAAASGRSLFLFGDPGNGKTSLAMCMRQVLAGQVWVPHCICIESNIIRIFDPQCHQLAPALAAPTGQIDTRWVRIQRPMITAGGEMTMAELDLAYSPSLRFYEAPPHVKANGGLFFLDDFGRQRINPTELLNRWIIPLEQRLDYLTLATGQKLRIPFRLMLIVATNLTESADPAFLRRIGYRIHVEKPDEARYADIFRRYAKSAGLACDESIVTMMLERYRIERRALRACEPRDLIDRCSDICHLRHQPSRIDEDLLDIAWSGYFGTSADRQ